MRNYLSCDTVADLFLVQVDPLAGDTISNLKLQKLCYYGQAWSLALRDVPVFSDPLEAWAHGPAVPSLYKRFRKYGSSAIDPYDIVSNPLRDLGGDTKEILLGVWTRYGRLTGTQLRNLTHREEPWVRARGSTPPGEACNAEITHDSMRSFYRRMLESANESDSRAFGSITDVRPRAG